VVYAVFGLLAVLSLSPVMNMLSFDQAMNRSFDRLHLMNTYGAFGTVSRERYEVILEGTRDDPDDEDAEWLAYELPCQPGPVDRAPCVRAPYHYRLDWQMWFAALGNYERQPWIVHLAYQLLRGEGRAKELLAYDPFGDTPPRAVRARMFRYRFARGDEPGWWVREPLEEPHYLVPLTLDDPRLLDFVRAYGWE
jgi:hypothetical protein